MNPLTPVTSAEKPAKPVPSAQSVRGRRRLMRQADLVERVLAYDAGADEALLNKAYVYAMTAHGKQFRASGDPYFAHPLEVAAILTDLKRMGEIGIAGGAELLAMRGHGIDIGLV